jgi:hypothetical protein
VAFASYQKLHGDFQTEVGAVSHLTPHLAPLSITVGCTDNPRLLPFLRLPGDTGCVLRKIDVQWLTGCGCGYHPRIICRPWIWVDLREMEMAPIGDEEDACDKVTQAL